MKKGGNFIRKTNVVNWVVALLLAALPMIGSAQNQASPVFAVVEYMKVKQGDEQKYIDLERDYWKKIHQQRIKNGEIVRWVLYEVRFAGSNDEYNYVTVALVNDPAKLENPFEGINPGTVLPGENVDRIMQETNESRQLVRRDLITMVSSTSMEGTPAPFEYIEVNFMKIKPGNEGAYMDVENNIWKPVHQQLVNDNSRVGWAVWQIIYPAGAGNRYQYVTTNYYSDFSKLGAADMGGSFSKAHPGKDINQLMQKTNDSREHVRTELWREVDSVNAE